MAAPIVVCSRMVRRCRRSISIVPGEEFHGGAPLLVAAALVVNSGGDGLAASADKRWPMGAENLSGSSSRMPEQRGASIIQSEKQHGRTQILVANSVGNTAKKRSGECSLVVVCRSLDAEASE